MFCFFWHERVSASVTRMPEYNATLANVHVSNRRTPVKHAGGEPCSSRNHACFRPRRIADGVSPADLGLAAGALAAGADSCCFLLRPRRVLALVDAGAAAAGVLPSSCARRDTAFKLLPLLLHPADASDPVESARAAGDDESAPGLPSSALAGAGWPAGGAGWPAAGIACG